MSIDNKALEIALKFFKERADPYPSSIDPNNGKLFIQCYKAAEAVDQPDDCIKACSKAWHQDAYYVCKEGEPTYKTYCHAFDAGWNARPVREVVEQPYWLCCGSIEPRVHLHGCIEAKIGHPEHCRFGTASEHSIWGKSNIIEGQK